MGHAVYHRTASGEAQLEDVSSLEAALELVERLRNEEGPTDVRLFKEISVEVRTYYRVVAAADADNSEAPKAPEVSTEVIVAGESAGEALAGEPDHASVTVSDDAAATASDVSTSEDDSASDDAVVVQDEIPAPTAAPSTEPPAGAMPLLSPPPSVTVHSNDDEDGDDEPAAAGAGNDHRPKLFNRS